MRMIFYTLTYKRKPATVPLSAAVQCPVSNLSSGSVRGSGHELLDLCWSTWQPVSVRGSGHELLGLCWPTCQSTISQCQRFWPRAAGPLLACCWQCSAWGAGRPGRGRGSPPARISSHMQGHCVHKKLCTAVHSSEWSIPACVQHEEQADQVELEDPHQLENHLTGRIRRSLCTEVRTCVQLYTLFLNMLSGAIMNVTQSSKVRIDRWWWLISSLAWLYWQLTLLVFLQPATGRSMQDHVNVTVLCRRL